MPTQVLLGMCVCTPQDQYTMLLVRAFWYSRSAACMTTPCFVQASGALKRASRGGMLVGAQLQAVASTLVGAARLQRSVMGASNAADGTGDYDLFSALTERIRV